MSAGSWAAPVPPPSGPAITGLGAAWGHRPRCQGCSPLPIHPGAHPGGCLCHLRGTAFPLSPGSGPAALTSESVWAPAGGSVLGPRVCTRFASWIEKGGQSQGICPPTMASREGLQPWYSPGTAAWRQRGRHQQRATPSPPAAPQEGLVMGEPSRSFPRSQIHPGAGCQGWNLPPSLPTPPCTVPGACSSPWGCAGRRCSLLARRPGSPRGRRCPTSASAPWT